MRSLIYSLPLALGAPDLPYLTAIGMGTGRTGTTSLKIAMQQYLAANSQLLDSAGVGVPAGSVAPELGPLVYHMLEIIDGVASPEDPGDWVRAARLLPTPGPDGLLDGRDPHKAERRDLLKKIFVENNQNRYSAAVDYPALAFINDLAELAPHAAVFLTTRDPRMWAESADETFCVQYRSNWWMKHPLSLVPGRLGNFQQMFKVTDRLADFNNANFGVTGYERGLCLDSLEAAAARHGDLQDGQRAAVGLAKRGSNDPRARPEYVGRAVELHVGEQSFAKMCDGMGKNPVFAAGAVCPEGDFPRSNDRADMHSIRKKLVFLASSVIALPVLLLLGVLVCCCRKGPKKPVPMQSAAARRRHKKRE